MSITKDGLKEALVKALPQGSQVLWTSACDTYASCKLQSPGNARATSSAAYDAMGMVARQAAIKYAASNNSPLDSFIAEFVDDNGSIVHTARFGGMVGAVGHPTSDRETADANAGKALSSSPPTASSASSTPWE
jgi:hypothetical protein